MNKTISAYIKKHERCYYCERSIGSTGHTLGGTPTADHIIPIVKGGNNRLKNIVPACKWCNGKKTNFLPAEFLEVMKKRAEDAAFYAKCLRRNINLHTIITNIEQLQNYIADIGEENLIRKSYSVSNKKELSKEEFTALLQKNTETFMEQTKLFNRCTIDIMAKLRRESENEENFHY